MNGRCLSCAQESSYFTAAFAFDRCHRSSVTMQYVRRCDLTVSCWPSDVDSSVVSICGNVHGTTHILGWVFGLYSRGLTSMSVPHLRPFLKRECTRVCQDTTRRVFTGSRWGLRFLLRHKEVHTHPYIYCRLQWHMCGFSRRESTTTVKFPAYTILPSNLSHVEGRGTKSTEKSPVEEKGSIDVHDNGSSQGSDDKSPALGYGTPQGGTRPNLPYGWQLAMILLTCMCTFGNHWSNGLIVSLKTTIIKETHINNSQFATLVAVTNLVNTFLCIGLGFYIDKFGGTLMSVILAGFHLSGAMVMSGAATNHLNSYPLLIVGKVLAAIGDGSLDNAQHRIFSTYFAPGKGFAFSIGAIWCIANLAQFTGQSTANVIAQNLGSYAWALWISSVIACFSFICAVTVFFLDRYLRVRYNVTDQTSGLRHTGVKRGTFDIRAIKKLPVTFWLVVLFAVFENAGVQSFVSISTQFAQQRLKKGAVVGGWVSSFYLLLPACLTPFLGIYIDVYGQRIGFLFASGLTFLVSMLLLKFSHSVPTFIAAYVFYALSQSVTPAPQVEIIRSIIPDPKYFATGFAIKKSVVQASIVIITTAAGKLQDESPTDSLDPAVTLWLVYAFLSVAVSGLMLAMSYLAPNTLPAARLSQIAPRDMPAEIDKLAANQGILVAKPDPADEDAVSESKQKEKLLKSPVDRGPILTWGFLAVALGIIFVGWIMFGLGVGWGVHGSVIAGTTGE